MISAVGEDGEEERIRVHAKKGLVGGGLEEVGGAERGEKGEMVVGGGTDGKEMSRKRVGTKEEEKKGGWGCLIC